MKVRGACMRVCVKFARAVGCAYVVSGNDACFGTFQFISIETSVFACCDLGKSGLIIAFGCKGRCVWTGTTGTDIGVGRGATNFELVLIAGCILVGFAVRLCRPLLRLHAAVRRIVPMDFLETWHARPLVPGALACQVSWVCYCTFRRDGRPQVGRDRRPRTVGFEHLGTEQHLGDVPANSEDCKSATAPIDPQDTHANAQELQTSKRGHMGDNTPTGQTPDYAPQPLPPPRLTGEGAVRISRARRRRVEKARRLAERARRRRVAKGVLTADAG